MSESIRGSYDDALYKSTYTLVYFEVLPLVLKVTHAAVGVEL